MGSSAYGAMAGGFTGIAEGQMEKEQTEEAALLQAVKSSAAALTKGLTLGGDVKYPTLAFTKMYRGMTQGAQMGAGMGGGGSGMGGGGGGSGLNLGGSPQGASQAPAGAQPNMYSQQPTPDQNY